MNSLEDAWGWYQSNRRQLRLVQRLGRSHPGVFDEANVAQDQKVRDWSRLTPTDTDAALAPLDDLAVLVLFSVFESVVRQALLVQVAKEVSDASHPVIRNAVRDAVYGIEFGSLKNNVLAPFKLPADADKDLIEHVDQVREYRNWVSHGRRGKPKTFVDPKMAYDRLKEFLNLVVPPPAEPSGN
jgi:hypothetical protein